MSKCSSVHHTSSQMSLRIDWTHLDQTLRCKEPNGNDAPGAVPGMHGDGIQRVVQVQLDAHLQGYKR